VARQQFLETVRRVAREGTTVILITHRVEEIVPEIDRVVLLKRGRVEAAGRKADVLSAAALSAVFGAPIAIEARGGFYFARAT
jgi:iron complex transport system ATP-binding protein